LQIHGGLLLGFLARVEQANGGGAVAGAETFLLASRVVVNVVTTALFSFIESVSLSHNCVGSDEVTTVDLDSGREQVGVTRSRPELNLAGTSAGTHLWKFTKPHSSNWLGLEARVGIERLWGRTTGILCLILQGIQADCVTIETAGFHLVC